MQMLDYRDSEGATLSIEISRRQFLAVAGSLAYASVLGLGGCGKSDLNGTKLYYFSVCPGSVLGKVNSNPVGTESTITFSDGTWHYAGAYELSGDWQMEGNDVVLTSDQAGTITLKKQDDGSYIPSGTEDLGERYFTDEGDAKSYSDKYTKGSAKRVKEFLEGNDWSIDGTLSVRTLDETISFADGSLEYTKGEYDSTGYLFKQGPSEDSWLGSDHSGKYDIKAEFQGMSSGGSSERTAMYTGTLESDGGSVPFTLEKSGDSISLALNPGTGGVTFTNGK